MPTKKAKKLNSDVGTAQQLADLTGEPYDTVDHWAGQGLLVFKKHGRHRLFPIKVNIARCKKIRKLQESGHNLVTIKGMLVGKTSR